MGPHVIERQMQIAMLEVRLGELFVGVGDLGPVPLPPLLPLALGVREEIPTNTYHVSTHAFVPTDLCTARTRTSGEQNLSSNKEQIDSDLSSFLHITDQAIKSDRV